MKLQEYIKNKFKTQRQYAKYLQEKYGMAPEAYFHFNKKGELVKSNKIGRGKEGLQCHHICEDIVADLSNPEVAKNNDLSYQDPENLCYCNLLEHFFLHILIAEEQREDENGKYLGDGGVRWMVLALNSIFSNPTESWFSRKGAYADLSETEKEQVDEVKGMCYNFNKVITDNKDTYLALVNRYCTSANVRIKEDLTSEELGNQLCIACNKDENVLPIYQAILTVAKDTFLFDWNVDAYIDLENYLKDNQTVLVKICTGGGKTTTGLEYLRVHNCKALCLGGGDTIEDSWLKKDENGNIKEFNLNHIDYMNYQSFMNCYEDIDWSKYDVVICDEAHHIKAEKWGAGIRWLIKNNSRIKIIGLTATPTPEQENGTDEEFQGRICYGLDLAEGIKEGDIYPFGYVQSIYKMEAVKDEFEKYGPTGKFLWDKLNIQASENPIEKILKDNMPAGVRKIVVFVQNIKDKDDVINALIKYDPRFASEEYLRFISSRDPQYAKEAKEWFNNTNDHTVVLVSRDMVNEGAHYEGVNTLIMFRSTKSNRLFLQQLGRIVVTTKNDNPNGMVFDFTNNAQTLIYRNKSVFQFVKPDNPDNPDDPNKDSNNNSNDQGDNEVSKIIETLKNKPVIYKDYTEDCVRILSSLKDSQNKDATKNAIYSAYIGQLDNIEGIEEIFELDLWSEAKTESGDESVTIQRRSGFGGNNNCGKPGQPKEKTTLIQKGTVKASDMEKVVMAIKLGLKRGYNFGAIDFMNNSHCDLIIKDKDLLFNIVNKIGFKNVDKFINIIKDLKQMAFIIGANI